ncbi:polymerase [Frankia sp. CcI156]|uniref:O-antigen polymerase n=1 Tax=Frankia casuarinae (strain DSM 45818 / CECT 9043 / HFP020203 / CcI3) TaxID=106370 RepID=Q2JCP7_FRACC|nr:MULTISPECIES: O-antigen ligase family protein [Frankia]ABD10945.1 O-antigen polymerase [Frankia casuarinae]ETA02202.1 hypothetical protein CcI6DRAFT_02377 [Frankia sp. CcI6]EYT92368.1 hypothetical protein ThrDRAFT_01978 [Frankia casuarinae]KDA42885.1 hypothetical protein BMG523Draft_02274 [Frankia sp. BMG5.23]OAA28962.1 O-antigen ligase like membrane protein [Frankia casuarinae]
MTAGSLVGRAAPGVGPFGTGQAPGVAGPVLAAVAFGSATVAAAMVLGPVGPAVVLAVPAVAVPLLASRRDAVTLLTSMVFVLFAVPATYRLPPLGKLTVPVGLCCLAGWLVHQAARRARFDPVFQPVRAATLVLVWVLTLSFAMMFTRVVEATEVSSAHRSLVTVVAQAGVTLLAADAIRCRTRLDSLLRRVVLGATFMAAIGGIEFLTGRNYSAVLVPPGLSLSPDVDRIDVRSGFERVAATAVHPIEFGVVLAVVLPLALHYAIAARGWARVGAWAQVAVIGAVLPMSVSRSTAVSLAVAILTLTAIWPVRRRLNGLLALAGSVLVLHTVFPGLIEATVSLFLRADADPSVTGRTEDYAPVWKLFTQRPLLGRGLGTFTPHQYFYLDNQLLGSVLETGVVGTTVLLVWVAVGLSVARGARRWAREQRDRELGQALTASILAGVASFLTFDALSFALLAGLLFLLIGCAGALWRMTAAPAVLAPGGQR